MRDDLVSETEVALQRIALAVQAYIPQFVSLQPDGSGSPEMLALRDALTAFPVPAEVLYIDALQLHTIDEGPEMFTLLRFEMSRPKTLLVKFVDLVRSDDLSVNEALLEEQFGAFPGAIRLICDLQLGSMSDNNRVTLLLRYDIRKQPEECARELALFVLMSGKRFSEPFLQVTDFGLNYNLPSDAVLPDDELLGRDLVSGQYRDCSYQQSSLLERQVSMANIQLIPQVPESVREVVRRAKRLYIFGHFEYAFFTIAKHYAYAALESAIFNRWNARLPETLQLEFRQNSAQHETASVNRMGWRQIQTYCQSRRWSPHKLLINGRSFPITASKVVDQLREDDIINDWQHWRIRNVYLGLRNSHSHLEFCSTDLPGAHTIERVVREINTLFDSLPLSAKTALDSESDSGTQYQAENVAPL